MSELLQNVIVGVAVLGAAAFVVRKVVLAVRPPAGTAACPSCASGSEACQPASPPPSSDVHPLVLVKPKSR